MNAYPESKGSFDNTFTLVTGPSQRHDLLTPPHPSCLCHRLAATITAAAGDDHDDNDDRGHALGACDLCGVRCAFESPVCYFVFRSRPARLRAGELEAVGDGQAWHRAHFNASSRLWV